MINRRIMLGTVFLDALGYGLLIPVMPDVVRRFDADPSSVSRGFGYFIAIYAVVQFAAAAVLGNLSDRYGRRPVLLASLAGAAIDYLLMAYAPTLWLLFVGSPLRCASSILTPRRSWNVLSRSWDRCPAPRSRPRLRRGRRSGLPSRTH